jgi:hypothetical protein
MVCSAECEERRVNYKLRLSGRGTGRTRPCPSPTLTSTGGADAAAQEQAIKDYLENYRVEVIVMVEGTDSVTSDSIQARHSYCAL